MATAEKPALNRASEQATVRAEWADSEAHLHSAERHRDAAQRHEAAAHRASWQDTTQR